MAQGPEASVRSPADEPSRSLGLARGHTGQARRWLARGEQHFAAGRLDDARNSFERAQQLLPEHAAPVVGLALVEIERSGYRFEFASQVGNEKLVRLLGSLERTFRDADLAALWLLRGRVSLMLGDAQAALPRLERAIALEPESAQASGALGVALLARGRSQQAVTALERAVELQSSSSAHWTNLGAALMMTQAPEQARRAYQRAVELDPTDARARADLGTTLITLGQARAALSELEAAHRLAPERATVMNNLGYAFQALGDLEQAELWYLRALDADAELGSAWVNVGVLRAKQERFDEAQQALERALELDPEDPRAIDNMRDLDALRRSHAIP